MSDLIYSKKMKVKKKFRNTQNKPLQSAFIDKLEDDDKRKLLHLV
ncbi:MAG: hypothetical protein ACTHJ7_03525 [Candidatus Nitrosocosmicus sp.]